MSKLNALRSMQELVVWVDVTVEMPDDETTVLIFTPDNSEPVFPGWHDSNDGWYYIDGSRVDDHVTHWAEQLHGPQIKPKGV
jgi:hypothetical protein